MAFAWRCNGWALVARSHVSPHWNMLMKNSGRVQHCSSDKYVEIDCHDSRKLRTWSNADLYTAVDVCVEAYRQQAVGDITKKRLKETQQALGFKATPGGLLADSDLRVHINFMGVLRQDWPHTFLSPAAKSGRSCR